MIDSDISVINFDKVSKEYSKTVKLNCLTKSVDAAYIDENQWYFIEFKNGSVDKLDVHRKIYDSIIMMIEMGIKEEFKFFRNNATYILVLNKKYGQNSENRNRIYDYGKKRANEEIKFFELDKLEGYLVNKVHTYYVNEFEQFIKIHEWE